MKWIVKKSSLSGSIAIPPSKSHTIRALLVASLADGVSTIRNPLLSGDGESALGAATALGAQIAVDNGFVTVQGIGPNHNRGTDAVWCGNSGTTTNLFTAAAALGTRPRLFDGDQSLRSRPVRTLLDALSRLGARYETRANMGDVPFSIQGPIKGGTTSVNGMSSQHVSSLLFSCPLAPQDTTFTVYDPHEKPYIAITLWWLKRCGIAFEAADDFSRFRVSGNQSYKPIDQSVPADFSGATFAATAALLTSSKITLTGLDFSDPQGDKGVFDLLERMGAAVSRSPQSVSVDGARGTGKALDIDLNAMPDALPALSVLATQLVGTTKIHNVAQARIKETDRIKVMASELGKLGAIVEELPDGLLIKPSRLKGTAVDGHDDHRVVMALALAGMVAEGETTIGTAESATITYPTFAHDFRAMGANIETME
jgi:3-phosphoshikimate 1-carboxyvinyltransferase